MDEGRALQPDEFDYIMEVRPQWADFDIYGHLNHAVYYALGDTVINEWMRSSGGVDSRNSTVIGVVASSECEFRRELTYPNTVTVGVVAGPLGHSSLAFDVVFWRFEDPSVADANRSAIVAQGKWRHVYIDRDTRKPTSIPDGVRRSQNRALGAMRRAD